MAYAGRYRALKLLKEIEPKLVSPDALRGQKLSEYEVPQQN